MKWQPPETAPKDGNAFIVTTAGPQIDIVFWDAKREAFVDYYHKQTLPGHWPYIVGWKPLGTPAKVCDTEAESREANGWPPRS